MGLAELCYLILVDTGKIKQLKNKIIKRKSKERFCKSCRAVGIFLVSKNLDECPCCYKNYCKYCINLHDIGKKPVDYRKTARMLEDERILPSSEIIDRYDIPYVFDEESTNHIDTVSDCKKQIARSYEICRDKRKIDNERIVRINIALS